MVNFKSGNFNSSGWKTQKYSEKVFKLLENNEIGHYWYESETVGKSESEPVPFMLIIGEEVNSEVFPVRAHGGNDLEKELLIL